MAKKDSKKRKNPGGRPKKADSAKRTERIELFVFSQEKTLLNATASREGQTLANWIRHRLGLEAAEYGG